MVCHQFLDRPHDIYPRDPWAIVEKQFNPEFLPMMESIFSLANGYFGIRGTFEEVNPAFQSGTLVNGFYESWPIPYGEEAHGFAKTGQTIINVPDGTPIKLYVDDEPLSFSTANLLKFERTLNMRESTLDREVLWQTPSGKQVFVQSRRFVSLQHRHLAVMSYTVTIINAEAPLVLSSEIRLEEPKGASEEDPRQSKVFSAPLLLPRLHYNRDRRFMLSYTTESSQLTLACGIDHAIETDCIFSYNRECSDKQGRLILTTDAKQGQCIRLTKYITYHTSSTDTAEELCARGERTLDRAVSIGFDGELSSHRRVINEFWRRSDVQVLADPAQAHITTEEVQQAIRFNLFHILQSASRVEGAGIPAKGLSGNGYGGNYFWDVEIYVMPFLTYTYPGIARNLMNFRYSMLGKARDRAQQVNQKGALFPWRTINGEEASAYYAASTAQYHINADIVYALRKYVRATGDELFLHERGVEILVETARLWKDLGFFSKRKGGQFCINGVTGPDEYNTVVNNNTFTNLMARENLWYAAEVVSSFRYQNPDLFAALTRKTQLKISEVEGWKEAANKIFLPFEKEMGIHPQDDSFLDRKPWDFSSIPPEKYPLLLHYHPLVIYRHQLIKQADIVLAMFLLGDKFSAEAKKANFDFYDPMTTRDSSLSDCIQGVMAAEIGYLDKAWEYGCSSLFMDLANVSGNTEDGCHLASMGGSWMLLVYGFGGMRDFTGRLSFRPNLPKQLTRLRFPLTIQGQFLKVEIDHKSASYSLCEGSELIISHQDQEVRLEVGKPVCLKL